MIEFIPAAFFPDVKASSHEILQLLAAQKMLKPTTGLSLALRTVTTATANIETYSFRGIAAWLAVTAASGTGGLQVQLQAIEPSLGGLVGIHALPTAVLATGTYLYTTYPAITTLATQGGFNYVLPARQVRFNVTHGDASNYTYSLVYVLIP